MSQLLLDLDRSERQVQTNDAKLRAKNVARLQRAMILMMSSHPEVVVKDGIRRLRISYSAASTWCRANLRCVAGMRADKSALRKATAALVACGVMAATDGFLWLDTGHLNEWYELLEETVEVPAFRGVSLPCPAVSLPCPERVHGVLAVSAVSAVSFLNEGMNELDHSFSQEGDPQPQLAMLPDLPPEIWDTKDSVRHVLILSPWWLANQLPSRLGIHGDVTKHALFGLIKVSFERGRSPAAYFQTARRKPAGYLIAEGRRALAEARKSDRYKQFERAQQKELVTA